MGCKDTQNYYLRASNYSLIKVHRYYETEIFYSFFPVAFPVGRSADGSPEGSQPVVHHEQIIHSNHSKHVFIITIRALLNNDFMK